MKAFIGWLFLWLFMPAVVIAADLETTSIRFERNQIAQSPLPVLVQIKTKTAVVEDGLRIVVGDEWNLDNNIIVSTNGLPSGLTPLPSLGNGVKTIGRTIDFLAGDLEKGVDYGFYISGGIGVNPSAGNYLWRMATLSAGVEAETMTVGVPIVRMDQMTITGTVRALASDFQLEIGADKNGDLAENEVVTYEINYGSYLKGATRPLIISAEWSRGTVIGSPTPSVDIVDYVIGSGSSAWGGVAPVIDLVNRRISWTITSFPANTINQKVSFQLRVNNSYTGQSRVKFEVEALLQGANVVTTNSKIINYFQPSILPTTVPTTTPTLIPTSTSTPSSESPTASAVRPSPTPTPIVASIAFEIKKISIVSLSESKIQIKVESNLAPSELKILYGLGSGNLNKSVTSINKLATDLINIEALLPETEYFFKIEAKTAEGKLVNSDFYIFKTAASSEGSVIDKNTVIFSVGDNVISKAVETEEVINLAIMIPNEDYAFRISIKKPELVKTAQIYIRNASVLGINTVYGAEPNSTAVDLMEIVNGEFVGHLVGPQQVGYYDVILRIENITGLITEDKVGALRIVDHFAVKDSNLKGIENAKVVFYRYIPKIQIYELMSQQSLGIKNPGFTEPDGRLVLSLPKGQYRVDVSSIGFEDQQEEFIIGLGEEEKLPTVIMEKTKMSGGNWWNYYAGTTSDALSFSVKYLDSLVTSTRFFRLINILILISALVVFFRFYIERKKIYWWLLPPYILISIKNFVKKKDVNFTWGKVVDKDSGWPIAGAKVYLLEAQLDKVMTTTITDNFGNFELMIETKKAYRLAATKDGYEAISLRDYSYQGLVIGNILMKMENILTRGEKVEIAVNKISKHVIQATGMVWLLILLILELLFWKKIGLAQTWVWLTLSGINIVGWLKR